MLIFGHTVQTIPIKAIHIIIIMTCIPNWFTPYTTTHLCSDDHGVVPGYAGLALVSIGRGLLVGGSCLLTCLLVGAITKQLLALLHSKQ